jgi:acetylornithine deacetylase/succinyl-diaminopimelate desuccinylase-like protein
VQIAARPHPYNSHANDHVRSFILSRLRQLAAGYPHVHVADDRVSNVSWAIESAQANSSFGVYFEGTNILVKVDGTHPDYQVRGGVLFSAHYDSVSTAPGVTDDGMGVATLLDLVKYLAVNRPERTAVFNINNGEEDGLHGARA